jgi:hypothetical protein
MTIVPIPAKPNQRDNHPDLSNISGCAIVPLLGVLIEGGSSAPSPARHSRLNRGGE